MITVAVDTSVCISAIVFGGTPRRVLELADQGEIRLAASPEPQHEVEQVLQRKFGWSKSAISRFCGPLWESSVVVRPHEVPPACRDPRDNYLLALAMEAPRSAYLVSGDDDLLVLDPFQGVRILTPAQFLGLTPWVTGSGT